MVICFKRLQLCLKEIIWEDIMYEQNKKGEHRTHKHIWEENTGEIGEQERQKYRKTKENIWKHSEKQHNTEEMNTGKHRGTQYRRIL